MARSHLHICVALLVLTVCQACFRESKAEQAPVTSTQATQDNSATLATGTDALGREGDFILEGSNLQAVVNGSNEDLDRSWFLGKNAGSIWDLSTRFESALNRELFSRNDDGIQQMTQGVNMNRHSIVSYDQVAVSQVERTVATLVMSGKIYDLDGSLEAAGAAVDSATRALRNCEVQTVLEVRNTMTNPDDPETDIRIFYLAMTTVVTNTGQDALPIYTVNDILATQHRAFNLFVPYPDWGFVRPDRQPGQHAYPPYLQFQPRQLNTAHYGFTSRTDGVLMADEEIIPQDQIDIAYIGKISQPNRTLAPGDAMTFVRECFPLNALSSGSESFLPVESAYSALIDILQLTPMPQDTFSQSGNLSLNLLTNLDQDGTFVIEMFNDGLSYYNGSGFVPLEEGRFFPVFGSNPVFSSYSNIPVPPGQVRMLADLANGDAVVIDTNVIATTDADGEIVTTEEDIVIEADNSLSLSGASVSPLRHAGIAVRTQTEASRFLFGHGILERTDGGADVTLGELPDHTQGQVFFVDSINSNSFFIPEGVFTMSMSHGPLFDIGSFEIEVADRVVAGSDPEVTTFGAQPSTITFTLNEQIALNNYWSADFDVRTDNDTSGIVSMRDIIRFAYAEDIDVLFSADSRNESELETQFRNFALDFGALDEADLANEISSFFDEIAVSPAIGTYGRARQAPKKLGRYALFNLPTVESNTEFEVPDFEGDPAGFYDRVREANPNVIIQVSRPRHPAGLESGLFTAMASIEGLSATTPLPEGSAVYELTAQTGSATRWIDFDLLQLLSGNFYQEYLVSRQDWFGLLNAGIFRPATGGTAPGEVKDLPIGTVRTYVRVGDLPLRENDLQSFWQAAKEGNSFVTNGPIIEADINGRSFGETTTAASSVILNLKVSAADWIPVDEIRIIVDGVAQDVALQIDQENTVRYQGQVMLTLAEGSNHWVVIEAGVSLENLTSGNQPGRQYGQAYPGHQPLAFTNPIFIGNN